MKEKLMKLIQECEEIKSSWNGDESGYAEDQRTISEEIIEKSKELIVLIDELNGVKNY
jgi:hypothetical protein